jgi:hypothetical protein
LDRAEVASFFTDKTVAIVGSGPGILENQEGVIDGHDVVLRANNYKIVSAVTGRRCDVFYSFFGNSIRKTSSELHADGVKLCMCKCPNAQPINSEWHAKNDKMTGVDFRWIYKLRENFWFCDTYIPSVDEFMVGYNLLGKHLPTTGFSAILDVLSFNPKYVFLTGFDFFLSGVHNVDKKWFKGDPLDPICHVPEVELDWLARNLNKHPIKLDRKLSNMLRRW